MGWVRSNLNEIRRMKAKLGGGAFTIELADGGRARFERDVVVGEMFMHFMTTLRNLHAGEPRPQLPALLVAIAAAKDRQKAFQTAFPEQPPFLPWDERALVELGVFKPRPLVASEVQA